MQPQAQPKLKTKKFSPQRHFLAVFFISFMWGTFGVDRMYLGKYGTGLLKLITAGGFGIWVLVDLYLIMNGTMRDKYGREMLQHAEYKAFAYKTVLYFAIGLGLFVLINGILLIVGAMELINSIHNGSTTDTLNQLLQQYGLPDSGATGGTTPSFN